MDNTLQAYLTGLLSTPVLRTTPLSGGDISEVCLIETSTDRFLLKILSGPNAPDMLEAERSGLDAIRVTKTIHTPQIMHCGSFEHYAILLMEYIESKQPVAKDYERLGHALARLHQVTSDQFGWEHDNFIGSLPQRNTLISDWSTFYIRNRLIPQLEMAVAARLLPASDIPDEGKMTEVLDALFADVRPSFVHGDLWSGNYLISTEGIPYLIDPAVYFGHFEADLAMSRLFGGFGSSFYQTHAAILPVADGWEERNELYQLYYLLVHLNLFGASYRSSVQRILTRIFN